MRLFNQLLFIFIIGNSFGQSIDSLDVFREKKWAIENGSWFGEYEICMTPAVLKIDTVGLHPYKRALFLEFFPKSTTFWIDSLNEAHYHKFYWCGTGVPVKKITSFKVSMGKVLVDHYIIYWDTPKAEFSSTTYDIIEWTEEQIYLRKEE